MNPTTDVLEQRIADLEGGVGALAASSGHAAQAMAIFTLCGRATTSSAAAGCMAAPTTSSTTPSRAGHRRDLCGPDRPGGVRAGHSANTKIIYGETLGNPDISVFPSRKWRPSPKTYHIPLMIDNTFATPYLCRPFEWGANIVTHSTTKFMGGHGTSHRRRDRGWRQLRLAQRPLRQLHHPRPQLPWAGLRRPGRRGLPPSSSRRGCRSARHRRLPGALQQLADAAGHRNAQPAHGPPRAANAQKWPNSWKTIRR
jgi:hypothetical protein